MLSPAALAAVTAVLADVLDHALPSDLKTPVHYLLRWLIIGIAAYLAVLVLRAP